jgi:hypothetical protein
MASILQYDDGAYDCSWDTDDNEIRISLTSEDGMIIPEVSVRSHERGSSPKNICCSKKKRY